MKIVVLSSRFPYPLEKGDKLRLYHQIRLLCKRHEIHLISLHQHDITKEHLEPVDRITSSLHLFKINRFLGITRCFFGLLKGMPLQVSYFSNKRIRNRINSIVNNIAPDVVYCQLARAAYYCEGLNYFKTIDYMDAFGESMNKRSKIVSFPYNWIYKLESKLMFDYESILYKKFDRHTIITEEDREILNVSNKEQIKIVPNGIDLNYFYFDNSTEKNKDIGFVGNMSYPPNIEATKLLSKEIIPMIVNEEKSLRVEISGASPHNDVISLANKYITITGWRDDIRDAYKGMKVFIAPIFAGTGQQNKILEAMAMGVPVITTSSVNKGIGAEPDEEILIADTPLEFKNQYFSLKDKILHQNIRMAARKFVETNCSWDSAVNKLESVFNHP